MAFRQIFGASVVYTLAGDESTDVIYFRGQLPVPRHANEISGKDHCCFINCRIDN